MKPYLVAIPATWTFGATAGACVVFSLAVPLAASRWARKEVFSSCRGFINRSLEAACNFTLDEEHERDLRSVQFKLLDWLG